MPIPRAVITGYGCISSLGNNAPETWAGMTEGRNGISPVNPPELGELSISRAGAVQRDLSKVFEPRLMRQYDRVSLLAILAAREALAHSGLEITEELSPRAGSIIGIGNCGWEAVEEGYVRSLLERKRRSKIFAVPRVMPSAPTSSVSMHLGLKGPSFGVTSACSSSNHAWSRNTRAPAAAALCVGPFLVSLQQCDWTYDGALNNQGGPNACPGTSHARRDVKRTIELTQAPLPESLCGGRVRRSQSFMPRRLSRAKASLFFCFTGCFAVVVPD